MQKTVVRLPIALVLCFAASQTFGQLIQDEMVCGMTDEGMILLKNQPQEMNELNFMILRLQERTSKLQYFISRQQTILLPLMDRLILILIVVAWGSGLPIHRHLIGSESCLSPRRIIQAQSVLILPQNHTALPPFSTRCLMGICGFTVMNMLIRDLL